MRNIRSLIIVLVASFALAACGGRKSVEEDVNVEAVDSSLGASSSGLSGDGSSSTSGLDGSSGSNAELLNSRVIYFE